MAIVIGDVLQECTECGKVFDTSAHEDCPKCGALQVIVEDELPNVEVHEQ